MVDFRAVSRSTDCNLSDGGNSFWWPLTKEKIELSHEIVPTGSTGFTLAALQREAMWPACACADTASDALTK